MAAKMKLGISMWSYVQAWKEGQMDIAGFIREAARLGADGVELLDFFYKDLDSDRESIQKTLAETGLPCGVFSVGNNFAKPTEAERNAELAKILFGVDEAVLYGAKVVRVFAGDVSPGIEFEQAREWIVEGLAHASKFAANKGVRLALENHGRLAGRSDQVRGIIDDVRRSAGNDALGANPDTGNFLLVGQRSDEAIRDVAGYATMVHFKDFRPAAEGEGGYEALDGTRFVGTAIGEGDVALAACVEALKEARFDGWLNIEYEGHEDPLEGVRRSVENTRAILKAV